MEPAPNTPDEQNSIFTEQELRPVEYFTSIRHARNAMYVLCAAYLVIGVIYFFQVTDFYESVGGGVVAVLVALLFFGMARYSFRRPYIAIITTLAVYIVLLLLDLVEEPASILRGLILKGVVLFYLFKAINDAKEHEAAIKIYEANGSKF